MVVRSKATLVEIHSAFHTEEPFKVVAKRLGMSPNTLRPKWKAEFGEAAFKARGKRLQAKAAAKTCRATAQTRVYKDVSVPCSLCKSPVTFRSNQACKMDVSTFVCDSCAFDRACPVCNQPVDGARGLSGHFRHRRDAGDAAHAYYEDVMEQALWAGKKENENFVVCLECGERAETLASHLGAAHDITAEEYKSKHPGALIRSLALTQKRSLAIQRGRASSAYGGSKEAICPSCKEVRNVSKFFGSLHDFRCLACKTLEDLEADDSRWEGKSEPEDYVECRLCGWKGLNLTGHLGGNTHLDMTFEVYRRDHPQAPWFISNASQHQPSANKLNLTEADLDPYKDEKGRVQVAQAAQGLDCTGNTVLRYCKELGITTRNLLATQKLVLDLIADILGEPYIWEWTHPKISNPATGYRLYYDGRFEKSNLVVEYQGKQHTTFVPFWHKTQDVFEQGVKRDAYKKARVLALGMVFMEVHYDEPYDNVDYLRGRLKERGYRSPNLKTPQG